MRNLALEESKKRVQASQRADYQPHGPDRALAPWSQQQNTLLDQCHYVPASSHYSDDDGYDDPYYEGSMSCRDIIDTADWHMYYSD